MINKSTLVKNLSKVQKKLCAYLHPMCDCKYGANSVLQPFLGEDNGCPELRLAMSILDIMTDEEYNELILRRAKINSAALEELK